MNANSRSQSHFKNTLDHPHDIPNGKSNGIFFLVFALEIILRRHFVSFDKNVKCFIVRNEERNESFF